MSNCSAEGDRYSDDDDIDSRMNLIHDDDSYLGDHHCKIDHLDLLDDDVYFDFDSVLERSSIVENGIVQDDIVDRRFSSYQLLQEGTDIVTQLTRRNGSHGTDQLNHLPIAHKEGKDCSKYDGSEHTNHGEDRISRSNTFSFSRAMIKGSTTTLVHNYGTHRNDCKHCNNDESEIGHLDELDDNVSFDYDSVLEYSSTVENGIARDDIADRRKRLFPPASLAYEEDSSTVSQLTLMRSIILSVADELHLMSEDCPCWDALSTSGLSPSTAADIIKLFKAKIGLLRQSDRIQEEAVAITPSPSSTSSSSSVSTRPEEASRRDHGGDLSSCPPSSIGPEKDSASDPSLSADSTVGRWEVVGGDDDWNPTSLPPFGLRSPEIAHLLHTWTTDEGKVSKFQLLGNGLCCAPPSPRITTTTPPLPQIKYLLGWIESLSLEAADSDHPPGIQITNISSILRYL